MKINYLFAQKNLRAQNIAEKANSTPSRARSNSKANRVSWMTNFWSWTVSGKEKWTFCLQHNKLIVSLKCKWTFAFKPTRRQRDRFKWCKLARTSLQGLRCRRRFGRVIWPIGFPGKNVFSDDYFLLFLPSDATVLSLDCTNLDQSTSLLCFDSNYKSSTQQGTTEASSFLRINEK